MPKFSIKDLLVSTTLVAVGCGALAVCYRPPKALIELDETGIYVFLLVWLMAGMLIGGGLGFPFRRIRQGAALGVFAQLVIGFFLGFGD